MIWYLKQTNEIGLAQVDLQIEFNFETDRVDAANKTDLAKIDTVGRCWFCYVMIFLF